MTDVIEIKWKIYKCNMELKQYQEALDEVSIYSICYYQ